MKRPDDRRFWTFDLFDTLITRTVLRPEDIFLSVGSRLRQSGLWSEDAARYRKLRVAADAITRRRLRIEEITQEQIYQTIASRTGWSPDEAKKAQAIEIEEELASVRPVAEMRARWEAIDPACKTIVSDTYFSLDVIEQMLERCGIQCDRDHIFLSSVYCRRKSTGKLFQLVAARLGAHPSQIHHVGDNVHSDLESARKEGLSAELFVASAPQRYENAFRDLDGDGASRIAGALRVARLAFPGGTERERTLWETGAMVAGPVLFSYVSWVIAQAEQEDAQHLFFLARDGQILLRIAKKMGPALPCSYLLASRQAWHLPSILDEIDESSLSWIAESHKTSSLRNVLSRIGIQPEEIGAILEARELPASRWDLPVKDRKTIELLLRDEQVRTLVFQRAREARERLLIYLQSQGVLAPDRIGFVDLGWNGRLQRSIARLLQKEAYRANRGIHGFYFSLKKGDRGKESGQFHAYFGADFAAHGGHAMLMELFCSADHGGLLGFSLNDRGTVDPILVHEEDRAVMDWGLPVLQSAILEAAENLLSAGNEIKLSVAELADRLKGPAAEALDLLAGTPTQSEAEHLGSFPFSYDQRHTQMLEMAPEFSTTDAFTMLLPAFLRTGTDRTLWGEGTLVRSLGHFAPLALPLFRWRDALVSLLQRRQ